MSLLRPLTWNGDFATHRAEIAWIWPGFLAPGNLTLLTGGWKSGKTTLVSLLLDRRRQAAAGPEDCPLLLNRWVRPGCSIVVSEEDDTLWIRRQRRLDFGPHVGFWCRPFAGRPTPERWQALLDQLLELRESRGVDLVVIDPLAMFLPGGENHPGQLLDALSDLQRLTQAGLSVLLLHHPAKGEPRLGQASRGSGALPACADILLELRIPIGEPTTRRRHLHGFSRYEETPACLSLELTRDGTDYAIRADNLDQTFPAAIQVILTLLTQSPTPLTRHELLAAWPPHLPSPGAPTLWRWLNRATGLGLVVRTGKGTKGDGFRYVVCEDAAKSAR